MPIHSVLSSASMMRLTAPGAPSLMDVGLDLVLDARSTTVRYPPKRPSACNCWPTTYIVVLSISALLAPPGMGIADLARSAAIGREPDFLPSRNIMGPTGTGVMDATDPPHSGPQLST